MNLYKMLFFFFSKLAFIVTSVTVIQLRHWKTILVMIKIRDSGARLLGLSLVSATYSSLEKSFRISVRVVLRISWIISCVITENSVWHFLNSQKLSAFLPSYSYYCKGSHLFFPGNLWWAQADQLCRESVEGYLKLIT